MTKIVAAGIAVLLLIVFLFLFRVSKIKIYGNTYHSAEEISADLLHNVFMKNTVYMLWKYRDGKVPSGMPYLKTLHVQMKSPSQLEVHVTEEAPVAYLEKDGYVYIDRNGTVTEISDQLHDGIPIVTGFATEEPLIYQKLPAESGAQLRTILSLTQLLDYQGVAVEEIRFGDNMEITIFTDTIEIQLGQDEYLEEKVANLAKILPRLDGQSGTLHLEGFTGRNEQVPFTPSEPMVSEDDTDEASGDEDAGTVGQDGSGGEGDASGEDGQAGQDGDGQSGQTVYPMVFNSSGTLVYNVHVENGTVVDEYGNPVPGVTVNEDGNVVDAYMNVFDSTTGELIQ